MDWNFVLQLLPECLCALLSLSVWVRNGSLKKMIQNLCPSLDLVLSLQKRCDELDFKLSELSCTLQNLLTLENSHAD